MIEFIFCCLLCLAFSKSEIEYSPLKQTYDELYHDAIQAYGNGNHTAAIKYFDYALRDYRYDRDIKAQCWIKCLDKYNRKNKQLFKIFNGQLENLHYFVNMKFCSDKCNEHFLGTRGEISSDIDNVFLDRSIYSYLQYSYFKVGQLNESLETAYTYYILHPDNVNMEIHVNTMMEKLGRKLSSLKSLEERPYESVYDTGVKAYNDNKYEECISHFEESLLLYYKELEKCHALCEVHYDNHHEMYTASLFKHLTAIIKCRQECRKNLPSIDAKTTAKNFFVNYFHYLQFCYFQVGKSMDAAINAKTYLLMNPNDQVMRRNMNIYKEQHDVMGRFIKMREKASKYHKENLIEVQMYDIVKGFSEPKFFNGQHNPTLLEEIESVYKSVSDSVIPETGSKGDLDSSRSVHSTQYNYRNQNRWKNRAELQGVKILHEEDSFNGTDRVAFDGVATEDQCEQLMRLVQKSATSGDGYQHNHKDSAHPFTKKEIFKGITVTSAVENAAQGKVSVEEVDLYVKLSEQARLLTQEYFDLPVRLNFAFTHLVCREALEKEIDENSEHISHPLHSDNCVLGADGEGTCPKRSPAYTWRDYSGLLYLNGNFTGGDFFFANYKQEIQARVRPKCGRFVAFRSNGVENLHGVLGVKKGIRCALPIWFTLSPNISEDRRADAENKLKLLKEDLLTRDVSWKRHGAEL